MTLNEIIERLEYFRRVRGITARELSLRIGKHGTYINKLECTDFNMPMSTFLDILAALGVGLEEFFIQDKLLTFSISRGKIVDVGVK